MRPNYQSQVGKTVSHRLSVVIETTLVERLRNAEYLLGSLMSEAERFKLESDIAELERKVLNPGLWEDPQSARKATSSLSQMRTLSDQLNRMGDAIRYLQELHELISIEGDSESFRDLEIELSRVESDLVALEGELLLSGEYDSRGALVTIRSGAGGDDATDFAQMLLRMYLRFCEQQGLATRVLDTSHAEGAGIKSATFEVDGPLAFGRLSVEAGTHRLVRMSPFNSAGKRQTSFAAVEVVPLIESSDEVAIDETDLKIDVFRSSGPGGQSVNTTDSAVRITHLPSGLVVSCQNEKSQLQNKQAAMRVLQSKLLDVKRQREEERKREFAGDVRASWGEQMRSYVLAPYQMVKDLRTEFEVNNPDAVFDGDLEGFIAAGIRWRKREKLTP